MILTQLRRYIPLLWCLALAGTAGAAPADDAPTALIRDTVEQLRMAVRANASAIDADPTRMITLIDQLVVPHVAAPITAKLVLGKHWRAASPAQREQFIAAMRDSLLRTYAIHARDYADAQIEFLNTTPIDANGSQVQIRTVVTRPGKPPAQVDYRMIRTDNGWKAFDAVINGISVVATFRAAVDQEIRQYGLDEVNQRLAGTNTAVPN